MDKTRKRKKIKTYLLYQLMLSIVMILFLGTIGIGYAAWNDLLTIDSTVITGHIEPVFSEVKLDTSKAEGQGTVLTVGEGKKLLVNIIDAQPGDVYYLDFAIKNNGTVPVKAETLVMASDDALDVQLIDEPVKVIKEKDTCDGRIKIKVREVTEDVACVFSVMLSFDQYTLL